MRWAIIVAAIAVKLWLTAARTLEALGGAIHDDRWFLETAKSIVDGRWLGPYSELTLIKGQGYPLFIAFVSSLHIPVLFAQQLLYALACLAVSFALRRASPVVFLVLLFNPMSFSDEIATRLTREGFYPALTLLVFAGVAGIVLRRDAPRREVMPWLLLTGVAIAVFWHTREEGVWILPLLAFAIIAIRRRLLLIAFPVLIFVVAHGAILLANGSHYGVYETVEFKEKSFLRAYGSLTHVSQRPPVPRIPVPKEVRERVYAVSPAFAELRPYLEGTLGANWVRASLPQGNGDIGGAWFMWALREAVAKTGYYARGAAAVREYYDRLASEVEAARIDGRLDARPARASLLPPILPGQPRQVLSTWIDGLIRVATFRDVSVEPRYSSGSPDQLRAFAGISRSRMAPRRKIVLQSHLVGWVVHVDGALDVTIERADGTPVPAARVMRLPSPDLYEHLKARWKEFPPARHARFDIHVPGDDAYLVLTLRGRTIERIPLGFEAPRSNDPNVRMSIDELEVDAVDPQLSSLDEFRLRVLRWIGRGYQIAFPVVVLVAVVLYIARRRWRGDWNVALLIAGALSAIAARVLILSLIDVTSFHVFTGGYQAPSHALLLVAAMLMLRRDDVHRTQ